MKISEQELALAEVIIRVSAIEKLLVKKGVFTLDELTDEMKEISASLIKIITGSVSKVNN